MRVEQLLKLNMRRNTGQAPVWRWHSLNDSLTSSDVLELMYVCSGWKPPGYDPLTQEKGHT